MLNYTILIIRILLIGFVISCQSGIAQQDAIISTSQKVPFNKTRSVVKLANELTGHLTNEEDKLLAIYTWIITNIEYDVDQMTLSQVKEQSIQKTLRRRKGVCMHYSQLMVELCEEAGLECEKIDGNVDKDLWVHVHSNAYHVSDHSWNGVRINGVWQLVDATFDAGYVTTKERKLAALLKRIFRIPYVRSKLKFVPEPIYDRYYMAPEEMILDHLPNAPFWQLLNAPMPIDTFRLSTVQKRSYMKTRPNSTFYNFNGAINKFRFDEFKEQFLGFSNLEYSDTNYFSYGFGQENYVFLKLEKYNDTEVKDIADCKQRYDEYDTLYYFIDTSKAVFKKQSSIEKIVHNDLNKTEKERYKLIYKENSDVIKRTNSAIKKDAQYVLKHKRERKKVMLKTEKLTLACEKLQGMQLKTKTSEEIISKAVIDLALFSVMTNEKKLQRLFADSDSINKLLFSIEKELPKLALNTQKALIQQANYTAEAEHWLVQFYSIYDSIYFEARKKAKFSDTIYRVKRDSLFNLFSKKRNNYVNLCYRNIVAMKKLIRANQLVYTEMSPFIDVDPMGSSIIALNQQIVDYYLTQIELYNRVMGQNLILNKWLKTDSKNQKQLKANYIWEKRTESARRRANQRFERSRHLYRIRELKGHQSILTSYKSSIRNKLKEIKLEAKEREKLEN